MESRRGGHCLLAAFCHSLLFLTSSGWLIRRYLSSSTLSSPSRHRQLESDRLQTGSYSLPFPSITVAYICLFVRTDSQVTFHKNF
ncbi:putative integral membrane protein [Brugia pahangi]|uniref:Secreted protein n=1 Tax=Brugia pahangi TaxID=6280 RepID=A0A0N4SZV1_BRUPA|nr:unnamed protein product [Brugia pahangi]